MKKLKEVSEDYKNLAAQRRGNATEYLKARTIAETLEVVSRLDVYERLERIEIKIEGLENRLKDLVTLYKGLKNAEKKTKTTKEAKG